MNINDLYDIDINIYKNLNYSLIDYLEEINNETFIKDIEEYYDKSFNELNIEDIEQYVYAQLSSETLLEKVLDNLYPEIHITYGTNS